MKLKRRAKRSRKDEDARSRLEFRVGDPAEVESILGGLVAIQQAYGAGEFEAVDSAVQAFFAAGTSADAEKVVKTLQTRLLSDAAIGLLSYHEALNRRNGDEQGVALFAAHRKLLEACRRKGIEAAFRAARRQDLDDFYWYA